MDAEDSPGVRLVVRIADMNGPPAPGSVARRCGRCAQPAWFHALMGVPPGMEDAALVCVPCALADPELGPQVLKVMTAAARLGGALPPAGKL